MQPRKLTMKNFGPFINESVDFGDFQDAGLFLISGKTGAGKTTIFDSMTFALFGETSGQLRTGKEMRSMFATPEEATSVTFTFEHQGLLYEIERLPEQEIQKKRGDGIRKQTAKVCLTIYDNNQVVRQYSKRTEVDAFIKELLHVDAKQFFQIILLPQGEFRNFLIASSNDKEKLLRNLFGTEIYQRVIEWLHKEKRALEQQLSKQQDQMTSLLSRFQWQEEKAFVSLAETLTDWQQDIAVLTEEINAKQDQLTLAKKQETQAEEQLYAAKNLAKIQEEYQQLQAKKTKLDEQKQSMDEIRQQIACLSWLDKHAHLLTNTTNARVEYEDTLQQFEHLQQQIASNEEAQVAWQEAETEMKAKRQQLTEIQAQLQRIENLLPIAKEVTEITNSETRVAEEVEMFTAKMQQVSTQLADWEQTWQATQRQLAKKETLQQAEMRYIQGEQLVHRWQEQTTAWQKTQQFVVEYQEEAVALQEKKAQLATTLTKVSEQFKTCRSDNAKMQIARLQLLLVEDEPCPVCGSTEHHLEATETFSSEEIAESEQQLNELEQQVKQVEQELQEVTLQLATNETRQIEFATTSEQQQQNLQLLTNECHEVLGKQVPSDALALLANDICKQKEQLEEAEQKKVELEATKEQLDQQLKDEQQKQQEKIQQLQQLQTQKELLQKQLQGRTLAELQTELDQQMATQQKLVTVLDEHQQAGEQLKLTTASLAEAQKQQGKLKQVQQQKVTECEEELATVLSENAFGFTEESMHTTLPQVTQLPELQQQADVYDQQIQFVKQRLEELAESVQQPAPDIDAFVEVHQVAKAQTEQLQAKMIQQQEIMRQNQQLFEECQQLYETTNQQLTKLGQLEQLYQTMSGDNPEKISIERYVLQSFLAEILEVANQRLINLTKGRYQFLLAEEKGSYRRSTGLEINIFDDNAGMTRRAHTLSGGESFIAALALALSLADVIQNRAGGIAIEALFIDEGFGSLDEESLEMAMEALEMIENEGRMIGIISHVRELKERIQQQLKVQTTGTGQSHIKSVV
uniref:AAA family ATPase n=1 Tax=Candidatus Enterococcus willemsii TaxID=1857215 RepID=UPI00403F4C41